MTPPTGYGKPGGNPQSSLKYAKSYPPLLHQQDIPGPNPADFYYFTSRMNTSIEFITDRDIYEKVLLEKVPAARKFIWMATSDLKDLHVHKGKRMVPFLEILSDISEDGVAVRLIHAKEPGPAFREDFDRYPALIDGLERLLCPRVHFKSVCIDGAFAYTGSANLTGAGMGAKCDGKRNFESGILTEDVSLIQKIMEQFDSVWRGDHCPSCRYKSSCPDRPDMIDSTLQLS
jgi:phosphatidylserine/phosphatidylglycerophosphate/cardiolipin synthase-like enzyme